jgi:hypothetical protein
MEALMAHNSDGSAKVYTPFDAEFVATIKQVIPVPLRAWYAAERCWWIGAPAVGDARRILGEFFPGYQERFLAGARESGSPSSSPHAVLEVRDDASPEVIEAAYRALARKHHPDVGGDTRTMQAINEAYDQIRAQVRR